MGDEGVRFSWSWGDFVPQLRLVPPPPARHLRVAREGDQQETELEPLPGREAEVRAARRRGTIHRVL